MVEILGCLREHQWRLPNKQQAEAGAFRSSASAASLGGWTMADPDIWNASAASTRRELLLTAAVLTCCEVTTQDEHRWSDAEGRASQPAKRQAYLELHPLSSTKVSSFETWPTFPKEPHANTLEVEM
jgi:hypothetical protein